LARILGATAMTVIVRLSSFLLVCIGVQDHLERHQLVLGFDSRALSAGGKVL
jgi:hypothetical protein